MPRNPAYVIRLDAGVLLQDAVYAANGQVASMVRTLAQIFANDLVPPETMREAYKSIGEEAQKSVLRSYSATVRRGPHRNLASYRQTAKKPGNIRYAGRLRNAIASEEFFTARADGLSFINTKLLNKEARHWARLNAGAGGVGRGSRRSFTVRLSGATLATIGVNMQARPSFSIPYGYWFDAREGRIVPPGVQGTSEFYPMGEGPKSRVRKNRVMERKKVTAGIKSRNFFDAGAATIASMLPVAYEQIYGRAFEEGIARAVNAKAPRPVRGGVTVSITEHRRYGARSHSTRFTNR